MPSERSMSLGSKFLNSIFNLTTFKQLLRLEKLRIVLSLDLLIRWHDSILYAVISTPMCCQLVNITAQEMKFSIKGFFSQCDRIRSFLRIWSHLLNKSLMENFINTINSSANLKRMFTEIWWYYHQVLFRHYTYNIFRC